ncbi:hypothetical protein [Deinococcus sp. DB0503]|uniref:hypothetical protein n=1 Tax=Deinococcus sp. DB0503 TaxID=2479203 RepID=UPI0018E0301C|nr:hypothetical protein [Deinococcus sp. DB0503]MBI0446394.1 hypothetical protein [Deinococcus sp. DB0503]
MTDPLRDGQPNLAPADGTQVNERTGQPDDRTGDQMPDPKDNHAPRYTTTPPDDRVGSADHGKYQPIQAQDPQEITGQFDHLATRDPVAMEHTPQPAEFAGAETVAGAGFDPHLLAAPVGAGVGLVEHRIADGSFQREAIDPNPGYTPPSEEVPPHVPQEPGDLLPGTPPEIKAEVAGNEDDTAR